MAEAEVQGLSAAHRQARQSPMLAVGVNSVPGLNSGNHVVEQIAFKRGESRRAGEDIAFGPVVLLGPAVGHDDYHRVDLAIRQQVIDDVLWVAKALPFRLV